MALTVLRRAPVAAKNARAVHAKPGPVVVAPRRSWQPTCRSEAMITRAEGKDFDAVLSEFADKFEKVENKPVVVGWMVAAVSAFIFTEWLIHLPALDIVLGFPLQLVGVLLTPVLVTRYVLDKKDVGSDVVETVTDISKRLPGMTK